MYDKLRKGGVEHKSYEDLVVALGTCTCDDDSDIHRFRDARQ